MYAEAVFFPVGRMATGGPLGSSRSMLIRRLTT